MSDGEKSGDYTNYLEGAYDLNIDIRQAIAQRQADYMKAFFTSAMVKVEQKKAREEEARRILHKEEDDEITDEEIDMVFANYGLDDRFAEYLVDGAVLTCNQATTEAFEMDGEEPIPLEKKAKETSEQFDNRTHTVLRVSENPISANGRVYATVSDTVKDGNIIPFRCHCKIKADREIERKWIKGDPDCSKYGVCRHLMRLNTEWENYPIDNDYLSLGEIDRHDPISDSYLQAVRSGAVEDTNLVSTKAGITMTSILFCKHGGLITPVDSGQEIFSGGGPGKFVGYLAYGAKSITQNPEEGYYMLYDGPTVAGSGEGYKFRDIYAWHDIIPNEKSGALQGYGGKNSGLNTMEGTIKYEGGDDYNPSNGVLYHDGIKRHAIALGPQLQNPNFTPVKYGVAGTEMIYGTCVDVTIELEGQTYYIPAVIVDTKGDTAPYGYVQTGIPFTTPGNEKSGVRDIKKDISEKAEKENYSATPNIVEWYVIQIENGNNKAEGLFAFNENGGIIIYRDEIAAEKINE
ncbi:MAG: hypothetical protein NC321_04010 [Clostridium sp.]|nr:hypothetical protein [Clostridium sp.]